MLKIRRMNADPNQWSTDQAERERLIPGETGRRAPKSASPPDERLRADIGGATESLHLAQSSRVQETKLANCDFGVRTQQPGRRNEADDLPLQEREILQTSLPPGGGFRGGQIKKPPFSSRINLGR